MQELPTAIYGHHDYWERKLIPWNELKLKQHNQLLAIRDLKGDASLRPFRNIICHKFVDQVQKILVSYYLSNTKNQYINLNHV